jgi:uncharacterized protein (TIGR03067 family)
LLFPGICVPEDADKELEKLQGEWTAVYHEFRGFGFKAGEFPAIQLTIKGDKWISRQDQKSTVTITLDPNAEPKHFDRNFAKGPLDGKVVLGLYKLEGDTLTIINSSGEKERPTGFSTKDNSALKLYVYQRSKP